MLRRLIYKKKNNILRHLYTVSIEAAVFTDNLIANV